MSNKVHFFGKIFLFFSIFYLKKGYFHKVFMCTHIA